MPAGVGSRSSVTNIVRQFVALACQFYWPRQGLVTVTNFFEILRDIVCRSRVRKHKRDAYFELLNSQNIVQQIDKNLHHL